MLRKRTKNELLDHLLLFDCTETEAQIYLESFQTGPASVQELARKVECNRVTAHSAIEQLIARGFLFETKRGKKRLIVAEDPSALEQIINTKINEVKVLESSFERLTEVLSAVKQPDGHLPSVEFYEDASGFKRLLERTLSSKNDFLSIINVDMFSEHVGQDYLLDYFARRSKKGVHSRLIFPPVEFAKKVVPRSKEFKIQVRRINTKIAWKSAINSWDDCVSLMSFTHNRLTCTIVENPDIAWFFRNIMFEMIWQQAEPIRV
ncbi:MAG: HTH domain-containing protein [Bdellovibrionota bacterium]